MDFLNAEKDTLACDAVIIADSANWRVGQPAITTTLRGNALVTVELRVSDHAVHSGGFGGAVPDALMAMARLLASLHDDLGRVAIAGLKTGDADPLDLKDDELRRWVGTRPSVKLIGDGSITSRLWRKPSISIIGLDATPVKEASNTLWPVATARLSMRVPPGQDAKAAQDALVKHLEAHAPWGAELKIQGGPDTGHTFRVGEHALRIGRSPDNDLILRDPATSGHHARLERRGEQWFIVDLGSTNGTLVNGEPVQEKELKNQDEIKIGQNVVSFNTL
jgi:acetylornithine deacetylase/succinyl-diaminopimelate desuccinylase-like protein